jgi:hypothetical protein
VFRLLSCISYALGFQIAVNRDNRDLDRPVFGWLLIAWSVACAAA